ncbi:hypothetical protein GC170_07675 [bacterium]|nr:hypothetical protein [bacterium]
MNMATQAPVKRPTKLGGSSFWTTAIFALLILIPCFVAFSNKLREFILLYRHQVDGVFAISPIVNYLLASLGFFFLFWWGICNGMFTQMEQPKRSFLEQEWKLDAEQARYEAEEAHREDTDGPSIYERSARMK